MSIFQRKLFLIVICIAIGVMVGLNMASSGIERIQGPISTPTLQTEVQPEPIVQQKPVTESQVTLPPQEVTVSEPAEIFNPQWNTINTVVNEPGTDRLAETTGGVLETVSQKGIEWIVSLFSAVAN